MRLFRQRGLAIYAHGREQAIDLVAHGEVLEHVASVTNVAGEKLLRCV